MLRAVNSKQRLTSLSAVLVCLAWQAVALAQPVVVPSEPAAALPAPAASELGWLALSLGGTLPQLSTTLGSNPPNEALEGKASGGSTIAFHYEKLLLTNVGARGFVRRGTWATEVSKQGGYGARRLYDLGLAPVLSWPAKDGPHGVSWYAFVPASFSWSAAPADAPRGAVRESADVGTGYRLGVGLGVLLRLSRVLGLVLEAEWAAQHVEHTLRFRRIDGVGPTANVPLAYDLKWLGASFGLAAMP